MRLEPLYRGDNVEPIRFLSELNTTLFLKLLIKDGPVEQVAPTELRYHYAFQSNDSLSLRDNSPWPPFKPL
jgi:hypothetical protein